MNKTSGTGQHAKLVIVTPTSAVSFGIQYDKACGNAKYRGKAAFMFENVKSNAPGGQSYKWVKKAARGQSFNIKLCYNKKGYVWAYVDGTLVGGVKNTKLKNKNVTMRAEGAVRLGGEKLDATFENIVPYWQDAPQKSAHGGWAYACYYGGKYGKCGKKALKIEDIGYGVRIYGKAKFSGDWDSNFSKASSLIVVY